MVVVLLCVACILTACNNDPKEEFISLFHSLHRQEDNRILFEVSVAELDMKPLTGEEWERSYADSFREFTVHGKELLEASTVEGIYHYDEEKNTSISMEIDAFKEAFPVEVVVKKNKFWYVSTSYIEGMLKIRNRFDSPVEINQEKLQPLEGKFTDLEMHLAYNPREINSFQFDREAPEISKEEIKQIEKMLNPSQSWKVMNQLLENANKGSFTKESDQFVYTFKKKDLEKFEWFKLLVLDNIENSQNLSVKLTLNEQTGETHLIAAFDNPGAYMALTADIKLESKQDTQLVSLPAYQEIITKDEVDDVMYEILYKKDE